MFYLGFNKITKLFTLIIQSLSIRLLKNLTLLNNRFKNNKVDKLTNSIIKEFKLIAITVKNNEISSLNSSRINKIDKILAKSKNIKKL